MSTLILSKLSFFETLSRRRVTARDFTLIYWQLIATVNITFRGEIDQYAQCLSFLML